LDDDHLRPARRFLHVCYCCADNDAATDFFVDHFAMRNTMSTPVEPSDGAVLGLDGEVVSGARFVYDARGPRTSPAIEVQTWVQPPLVGTPVDDPTAVGIQAIGFAVPDMKAKVADLTASGCTVAGSGSAPFGASWTAMRDAIGVTIDLVEDASVPADETRMRHLRATVSDLATSVPWYEGLGFAVVDKHEIDDSTIFGLEAGAQGEAVRLRLPDEPFEAMLVEWRSPRSHGRHTRDPNRAGLYRAALGVDDTRAAYEAMTAVGWTFDRAPLAIELHGTSVPEMWICFISDPDGVPFEFVGRPRSAFR
jgi:catechol 2,3-dioxygenase-like lactoylglutathione lyase family enzyme